MPKLSIIVPVYNIEQYLPRCLDSILKQQNVSFEVLLINDGSTDTSGQLCDVYAKRDNRIRVFHQINNGVSVARNVGIRHAKGSFVCFIDGDDWIEDNSLELLLSEENSDCDMVVAKSFVNSGESLGKEQFAFDFNYKNRTFSGVEVVLNYSYSRGVVWGAVINRNLLMDNKITFPIGIKNGEDSIFATLCQIYAKKVKFLDVHFYNVFERMGSASRSWDFDRVLLMTNNLKYLNDYKNEHPRLSDDALHVLNYRMFGTVANILNLFYDMFSINNFLILRKRIKAELNNKLDVGKIKEGKNQVKLLNCSLDIYALVIFINKFLYHKK